MKRGRYDLVHCHGFQVGSRAGGGEDAGNSRFGHHPQHAAGRGIAGRCAILTENMLRSCTAKWVAVSAFLRNYAWNVLKVPDERTEVIANGIDMPQELPPWSSGPVGVVARLAQQGRRRVSACRSTVAPRNPGAQSSDHWPWPGGE